MPNFFRKSPICLALGLILSSGCGSGGAAAGKTSSAGRQGAATGSRLRIVTTVGMVTDIVREVVGERGEVIGLRAKESIRTFTRRRVKTCSSSTKRTSSSMAA